MNAPAQGGLSSLFIHRPVATSLLTLAIALAGALAFKLLPVSALPQVDFPTIAVSASLPGASPDTMAATVATPLERTLGRIAGVTEMTSTSSLGSTRITLQFDLSRDIDGAAREVQAAINAARGLLPTGLPSNPTYRKVNPADAPVLILSLTSPTLPTGQLYDAASTVLAQKISQVKGVGQVDVGGASLPAVRVALNPPALHSLGVGVEAVRNAIVAANANRPKGALEAGDRRWQVGANDQARTAADYAPLVVAWRNGAPVRLSDVADVVDSVQDLRNAGLANGQPSVQLLVRREPGANVIETVDHVLALLPQLRASVPAAVNLRVVSDSTRTIRASLHEVERTLLISVGLVVAVVFVFLRRWRATLIPAITVPVSLLGALAVMYLCGFSLDNLSLMALTVAAGFVVDDAVVVLENTSRHLEAGLQPMAAALKGAREVGFTVLSMSLSLVAVFIPILFMGGIIGRLFREFAVTLSVAIGVSMLIALSTTPMMCAHLLRPHRPEATPDATAPRAAAPARAAAQAVGAWLGRRTQALARGYARSLDWVLGHPTLTLLSLAATVALNVSLYVLIPKGFLPQQDTGRLVGTLQADQSISFQALQPKLAALQRIVAADPAVRNVVGYIGGGQRNGGFVFVDLRPQAERDVTADQVVARLRGKLARVPGAALYLQVAQDIRVGGRAGNAQYQYTLQADDLGELRTWEPRIRQALSRLPALADVSTDQQDKGLQTRIEIDRDAAARLRVNISTLDATLNDLFGQRQVSTIYNALNQYRVVLEAAPRFWQDASALDRLFISANNGQLVPLSQLARWSTTATPLAINHQSGFVASTLSFNLAPGQSLSQASQAIAEAWRSLGVPSAVRGSFQGTAKAYEAANSSQPWLILTALLAVYIVLGVLYESLLHPLTILSTLPSAGVGALLALMATGTEFSLIALIGVILLIGIVKKNAIMMVDFALDAQRQQGLDPRAAIHQAGVLRLRPILMTTLAALLGAVPLALGGGEGAELRTPLGIAIVGGLLVSQVLTLYTTPVVYLQLERLRQRWRPRAPATPPSPGPGHGAYTAADAS